MRVNRACFNISIGSWLLIPLVAALCLTSQAQASSGMQGYAADELGPDEVSDVIQAPQPGRRKLSREELVEVYASPIMNSPRTQAVRRLRRDHPLDLLELQSKHE